MTMELASIQGFAAGAVEESLEEFSGASSLTSVFTTVRSEYWKSARTR